VTLGAVRPPATAKRHARHGGPACSQKPVDGGPFTQESHAKPLGITLVQAHAAMVDSLWADAQFASCAM
jgi:hypothetical protein